MHVTDPAHNIFDIDVEPTNRCNYSGQFSAEVAAKYGIVDFDCTCPLLGFM